jgi:hypothetical protein
MPKRVFSRARQIAVPFAHMRSNQRRFRPDQLPDRDVFKTRVARPNIVFQMVEYQGDSTYHGS